MSKSEVKAGLYQDDKSVEFGGTKIVEKLDVRGGDPAVDVRADKWGVAGAATGGSQETDVSSRTPGSIGPPTGCYC